MWSFPWGYPNSWMDGKTISTWMIWGYPHFRKLGNFQHLPTRTPDIFFFGTWTDVFGTWIWMTGIDRGELKIMRSRMCLKIGGTPETIFGENDVSHQGICSSCFFNCGQTSWMSSLSRRLLTHQSKCVPWFVCHFNGYMAE